MAESRVAFNDGEAYERFMGRWSRAVGGPFLEWLAPPTGAHWLDVGCGTGAFTELVLGSCSPASIVGVDPFAEQVEYARQLSTAPSAEFKVADALNLPFPDRSFDVVASALVINFISDRSRGLSEMRRVAKPGGVVAGYVWDFAGGRSSGGPLVKGLRSIGIEPPTVPGSRDSSIEALQSLFREAGLQRVEARTIEVTPRYRDFEDFWTTQSSTIGQPGKFIATLPEAERLRLRKSVMSILPPNADGSITYAAHANAIKAHVPQ
jgi:SAM-dependent methyltransferase